MTSLKILFGYGHPTEIGCCFLQNRAHWNMALCSDGGNIQKYSRPLTVLSSVVRDHVVVVEDIYVMLCLHQK